MDAVWPVILKVVGHEVELKYYSRSMKGIWGDGIKFNTISTYWDDGNIDFKYQNLLSHSICPTSSRKHFSKNSSPQTQTSGHQTNQDRQDHWRRRWPQLVLG